MMYSDFNEWRNEMNRITKNLNHATPQKAMEGILCWQINETRNSISQLKNELNMAKITATLTTDFGRDEKGRMIFTAKQAARAVTDSYKLNWFQYIWNLIDYKRAEHYVLKKIAKRANKGHTTIRFSESKWPFNKFPELIERLEFLGFEEDSTDGIDNWCDLKFRWY